MDWAEKDPRRWLSELDALFMACVEVQREPAHEGLRAVRARVRVGEKERRIRLQWPANYPDAPPQLIELDEAGERIDHAKEHHELGDQTLCLFTQGHGPRSWRPEEYTAATAVQRFIEFRELADHGANEAVIWDGDASFAGAPSPFVVRAAPELSAAMWGSNRCGLATLRWMLPPERLSLSLFRVQAMNGAVLAGEVAPPPPNNPLEQLWRLSRDLVRTLLMHEQPAAWAILDKVGKRPWSAAIRDRDTLLAHLKGAFPGKFNVLADAHFLLIGRPDVRDSLLAFVHPQLYAGIHASSFVAIGDSARQLFERIDPVLPARPRLGDATVVMVGLGSLGGSVAVSLAKSGVGNFLLFDPDRLAPENISRHVADLDWLDAFKVSAVAHLIRARNPNAKVEEHPSGLWFDRANTDPGPGDRLREALRQPNTIVVVTAADDALERTLNRICIESGTPLVVGAVLGDAEHGRVFRVIPGETACYACILDAQRRAPERHRWFGEQGSAMPGRGAYRGPGVPGLSIDVEQVALLVARLALGTLRRGLGEEDADEHHLLWTNRGGWGFDRPLQLQVEAFERDPACRVCGSGARALTSAEADELAAAEALID